MKRLIAPLLLLCLLLTLTACSSNQNTEDDGSEDATPTLEELCGESYQSYLTETITMQMENRMEKTPEVVYYPIDEQAPLEDSVTIDATTEFEVNQDGDIVIYFPAGTVTDEANGEQSFIIPVPEG